MTMENFELKLAYSIRVGKRGDEYRSLAWNPVSGKQGTPLSLAFCGSKFKVRVWDLISPDDDWKLRYERKIFFSPASCAWSPCGQLFAVNTCQDTAIFRFQEDKALNLLNFCGAHPLRQEDRMGGMCWSTSGSLFATCCNDSICVWKISIANMVSRPHQSSGYKPVKHENCASLPKTRFPTSGWNIEPDDEFELIGFLRGHAGDVNYVQWHPKIDILFSCGFDKTIKVWADQDGHNNWQCVQTLGGQQNNGHDCTVWSLSFNADGDKLVTSSDDGTLKIWENENEEHRFARWKHLYTLTRCHDGAIFSVDWSREGIIATGGADGTIGLFVQNSECEVDGSLYKLLLKDRVHAEKVNVVQWSPGENQLLASASTDETIKVWKLEQAIEEVQRPD